MDDPNQNQYMVNNPHLGELRSVSEPYVFGSIKYEFVYSDPEASFPTKAIIFPDLELVRKYTDVENDPTRFEKSSFEEGMICTLMLHGPNFKPSEEFLVQIVQISEDGKIIEATLQKPQNLPISTFRPSVIERSANRLENDPPWLSLVTLSWFRSNIESNLEFYENTFLVKLTPADKVEIRAYNGSLYRYGQAMLNDLSLTNAICIRQENFNVFAKDDKPQNSMLSALRLFKAGDVDFGLTFTFNGIIGFNLFDAYPYRNPMKEYFLDESEIEAFKAWLKLFNSLSIEKDSPIDRALYRLERTYDRASAAERITDAVIGLEALASLASHSEITYRVSQRIAFLLSKTKEKRASWAGSVSKFYEIRSAIAHSNTTHSDANEDNADTIQHYLRLAIKKILEVDTKLSDVFCKKGSDNLAKQRNNFFESIIYFGSFDQGLAHWLQNPDPKNKTILTFSDNEED